MDSVKVSIIVPVYRTEKYIERCVRSLMEQTLKEDIEFIFINDATPDNSMEVLNRIVSEYPERRGQILILHNLTNIGIAETRKRGIEAAKGEYIGWCDSDDWCELNMFETMLESSENGKIDIVVCNSWWHGIRNGEKVISRNIHSTQPLPATPQDVLKDLWRKESHYIHFPYSLWHQISKKKLIRKSSENISPTNEAEDVFMLLNCFYYASSAKWIEGEPLYHYNCYNINSLTRKKHYKKDWLLQEENIDKLELLLSKDREFDAYKLGLNWLKITRKARYKETFSSCWDYWKTYRESYKNIHKLTDDIPNEKRWKVWLTYNFYPLYWWINRKTFKKIR